MQKPNIILITLDALRADHLGCYGYPKGTSPFIDGLAKRGVLFNRAFSTGSATPQSFPGIMASTYPMDFGGYAPGSNEKRTFIAEALQKSGYVTMGFHSNAYLSDYFGYNRGWNSFNYLSHFKGGSVSPGMRSGTWQFKIVRMIEATRRRIARFSKMLESVFLFLERSVSTARRVLIGLRKGQVPAYYTAFEMNQAIKEKLSRKPEEPLFLWVHYMDAHAPYGLFMKTGHGFFPKLKSYFADYLFDFWSEYPRINQLFSPFYENLYDAGIRHIDDAVKDLFDFLSSRGIFEEDTFVFITADHGEEFGEHGGFQHMQKLFNENIKVPLIAIAPEKAVERGIVDVPRSTIDIAPTIARHAGVQKPKSFRGQDLFAREPRNVVAEISEHEADLSEIRLVGKCVVADGYKLISGREKFLFSLEDKRESRNVFSEKKEIAERLSGELENFVHQ